MPAPAPAGATNPLTGATETTLPGLATFKGLVLGLVPYAPAARQHRRRTRRLRRRD
jgi:hypothetical protein